jgi:hypothetical protein
VARPPLVESADTPAPPPRPWRPRRRRGSLSMEQYMTLQNAKHETFCQHFATNGNAAEAARAIGHLNYPAQRGSDLLRRPLIQARVEELLRDRPSLPARLARHLDAATLHRAAQAISFHASLA